MFILINGKYINTRYISGLSQNTEVIDNQTKYVNIYTLINGANIKELFDTQSDADSKYEEIENSGGGGVTPTGTIDITQNGTHNVSDYASANVNVEPDLSEYFETEPTTILDTNEWAINNYIKKLGTLIIPDNMTSLMNLFTNWKFPVVPIVYCNNNITNMNYAFGSNGSSDAMLGENLDLTHLNVSNVTTMEGMFKYSKIITIDTTGWDVGKVKNMSSMFSGCINLTSIDLSHWNPSSLTNVGYMFAGCSNLAFIDIRQFTLTSTSYSYLMFGYDSNGVPANCLIIVKDQTQKDWVNTNFTRLTNVKTVAEYEEMQVG